MYLIKDREGNYLVGELPNGKLNWSIFDYQARKFSIRLVAENYIRKNVLHGASVVMYNPNVNDIINKVRSGHGLSSSEFNKLARSPKDQMFLNSIHH